MTSESAFKPWDRVTLKKKKKRTLARIPFFFSLFSQSDYCLLQHIRGRGKERGSWENVEEPISCLALRLRMIKNKVNPAAAEGTRSCEGGKGRGGREEKQWRRRRRRRRAGGAAADAPGEDSVCSSVRRTGMRSRRQLGHQADVQSGVRKCWRSFFLGMLVASVEIMFLCPLVNWA